MVLLHIKRGEGVEWLLETATTTTVDTLIEQLCDIWHTRCRLHALCRAATDLLQLGPYKPFQQRMVEAQEHTSDEDEPSLRVGEALPSDLSGPLYAALNLLEAALSADAVKQGAVTSGASLRSLGEAMRKSVAAAVPDGLPVDDPVLLLLAEPDDAGLLKSQLGVAFLDPATAELWWAGKPFARGQTVGDRAGRNEKTRIVAHLQSASQGAPGREPAVSEAERRAMMAWYFKKQEEEKALAENADDWYLSSAWADPRALKTSLNGTGGVSWKPMGGAAGLR